MPDITSDRNPRIKRAAKLRVGRHRQKLGRFLIDGVRELGLARRAGVEIDEVFICPWRIDEAGLDPLVQQLASDGATIHRVAPGVMEKIAFGDRSEGIVTVAVTPPRTLAGLALPDNPVVAVLEGVEKPGNLGAVLRTADAAGLDATIVADAATDLFNPNVIRASLGAVFTHPLAAANAEETLDWLREQSLSMFAARVDGGVPFWQADFTGPTAIVLGSEADGLSSRWPDESAAIALPMHGSVDSLNVSVTAGVLFYEVLRQRGPQPGSWSYSSRSLP